MIYLDSSALLKLLVQEQESDALETWLAGRTDLPTVTSALARVEVLRATRRLDSGRLPDAVSLLAQLDQVPMADRVLDVAGELGPDTLRSLDAIHLASALALAPDVVAFVTYDQRLYDAAGSAGLPAVAPGR